MIFISSIFDSAIPESSSSVIVLGKRVIAWPAVSLRGRPAAAQSAPARPRIDVHHHFIPQFHIDSMMAPGRRAGAAPPKWSPALSLEDMDKSGIATSILSISEPSVFFGGHYNIMFPRNVYWSKVRQPGQPFKHHASRLDLVARGAFGRHGLHFRRHQQRQTHVGGRLGTLVGHVDLIGCFRAAGDGVGQRIALACAWLIDILRRTLLGLLLFGPSSRGRHLGVAFQITDDLLDVTGTDASLGKSAGRDLALRKAIFDY